MTARFSAEDRARGHFTQADIAEYNAFIAEHGDPIDPEPATSLREEPPMPAKYVIDSAYRPDQLHEETGLPVYPKSTGATETRLRNTQKQIKTTLGRVEAAIDRALDEFAAALEAEDRKATTQARIDSLTKRPARLN